MKGILKMGFTKNKGVSAVASIIVLVIINLISFLSPVSHTITFWLGYSFATFATLLMLATTMFLFDSENEYESFARLSIPQITWIYFVLQMILSICEIFNFALPYLVALVVNCCLTGLFLILILSSKVAIESIQKQEEEANQKVLFLQNIQVMLSSIVTNNDELSNKIKELSEDFQFSDPMSHSMLSELEKQIELKVVMLKSSVDDVDKATAKIDIIKNLLNERNQKCKLLKNVKEEKKPKDNSGVKYVNVALGVVGIMAVVALVITFIIVPNNKYNEAKDLYNAGKYAEAIVVFEDIKGYSNSEEMIELSKEAIKENTYIEAKALLDEKKYDSAIALFEGIIDYKDSKTMIDTAKTQIKEDLYLSAEKNVKKQNYLDALRIYRKIRDYKDSEQKIQQVKNLISGDSIIYFGSYNNKAIAWETIKTEDNKLLLITRNPIVELAYNDELKNVEWGENTLCDWLKNDFVKSFTAEQRNNIISTKINGVSSKTFILNKDEIKEITNTYILASNNEWWSCSKSDSKAMYVDVYGTLHEDGENVIRAKGVRPCIWLSLE